MSSIEIVKRNCIKNVKLCYIIKISAQGIREKEGFSFDVIHLTYLCFVFRNSGLHEVKFSGEVSWKSSFRVLDPVFLTRPDITNMGFQNYFKLPIGRKKRIEVEMYELLPSWLVLCTSVSFVGSILAIMAFVRPDISSDNGPIPCWLPADTANKYSVSGLRESTVTDWTYCGTWIILVSPPEREKKISDRNELQQLKIPTM